MMRRRRRRRRRNFGGGVSSGYSGRCRKRNATSFAFREKNSIIQSVVWR